MAINYLDLVFKILTSRRVTDSNGKYYFNEFGDETLNIHVNELWADRVDPDTLIATQQLIVEYKELFTMTEDVTVPLQEAWYAEENGQRVRDWVPDKYGPDYVVHLYDAEDKEIFPTNDCEWYFNFKTGILTFNNSAGSFPQPFKISAYKYIGKKGVPAYDPTEPPPMADGITGIHLFPIHTTPYNKSLQMKIPMNIGKYSTRINLLDIPQLMGKPVELCEYSIGANRYSEGDYIDIYINGVKIEDSWYTRESPERDGIGNGGIVYTMPPNSIIDIDFFNESNLNKTVWFKFKMLYTP